ncbi:hypothetical protein ACTOV4_19085 [Brucella sp. C7-11G]
MVVIGDEVNWRDREGADESCDASPTTRLLELSTLTEDSRNLVNYEPQDVDDAIGKLVYLAASIISGRITLTKCEVAAVLKSVDKKI